MKIWRRRRPFSRRASLLLKPPPPTPKTFGCGLQPDAPCRNGPHEKAGKLSFPGFFKNHFLRKKGATIFENKEGRENNQAEPDEVVPAEGFTEIQGGKEGENRQGNDFLNGLEFRR